MNTRVLSSSDNEINLSITDSDIATLYIVQHELLKHKGVDFAGAIVKHPLTNECWMRVGSKKNPVVEITAATETAIKQVAALEKLFASTIQGS